MEYEGELLIAPVGIEIISSQRKIASKVFLLIAPVGIEIRNGRST